MFIGLFSSEENLITVTTIIACKPILERVGIVMCQSTLLTMVFVMSSLKSQL